MNPYKIVEQFEDEIALYTGAEYGIAVDSCTNAIFLSAYYLNYIDCIQCDYVIVPAKTYPSIPMSLIHAGYKIHFIDCEWDNSYKLSPLPLFESAKKLDAGMFNEIQCVNQNYIYMCLSFHLRKPLAISKGGMILTNNQKAVEWFKKARYEGREGKPLHQEKIDMLGWNMTMPVDVAARGLHLMLYINERNNLPFEEYPDLRCMPIFQSLKNNGKVIF